MSLNATPREIRHAGLLKWSLVSVTTAAFVVQVFAGLRLLGLHGDGAHCLRVILGTRRPSCIEAPRRAVQWLLEAPTVAAQRLGLADSDWLAAVFSLSVQLTPLMLLGACIAAMGRAHRLMWLFPLLAYFAGSASIMSVGLLEGPTVAAYFWLLLALILFRTGSASGRLVTALVALPALFSHESMALLAPVLALAASSRARDAQGRTVARFMAALAIWFAIVCVVQIGFTFSPRDAVNRDGFIAQMLAFRWLVDAAHEVNIAACVGLLAMAAMAVMVAAPRLARASVAVFAVVCVVMGAAALLLPSGRGPIMQFYARNQPGFVSIVLAFALLALRRRPQWQARLHPPAACSVLMLLAVATCLIQAQVAADWSAYLVEFRRVLRQNTGVVTHEAMEAALTAEQAALFAQMRWRWTTPDMSILLSDRGEVRSLIANPVSPRWQPWDPLRRDTYPEGKAWRYCETCGFPTTPGS